MKNFVVTFKDVLKWTLLAGLITGTLDALGAIIVYQANPGKMFQFISSGALGRDVAFSGGAMTIIAGIFFHYLIATAWCFLFFLMAQKFSFITRYKIVSGILYGAVIWFVMNLVIVPLSKITSGPIQLKPMLIGMSILIVAVGIPVSFLAGNKLKKLPQASAV